MVLWIIMGIIAYVIGSINFSVILSKKIAGFDVREKGSGNAGTTNMLRSVGKGAAALTLICDVLKGVKSGMKQAVKDIKYEKECADIYQFIDDNEAIEEVEEKVKMEVKK